MNTKKLRLLLLAAVMLVTGAAPLSAADPAKEDTALFERLVAAFQKADYDTFVAEGDAALKKGLKKEAFEKSYTMFGARFKSGYEPTFLGELKQFGCHVTLWKLSFKDQSDDALLTLAVKENKLAGVWIK